jgi:hypothetical protein
MRMISEIRQIPVIEKSGIIVAGGGISGISAALAAARLGQDVLMIEKSVMLGGLATLGLINWYEPLCDGNGEQLITGIAHELLRLAIRYGPDDLPKIWENDHEPFDRKLVSREKSDPIGGRYATHYSPALFSMALEDLLVREGVKIRFDILAADPVMENGRCTGVICESKSGRECFMADVVIDATGDADILYRAGVSCAEGVNFLTYVAHGCSLAQARAAADDENILGVRHWFAVGSDLYGNGHPPEYPRYSGVRNEEVTRFLLDGRHLLFDKLKQDSRSSRDITALPGMAQFRTTRRLVGEAVLSPEDQGKKAADSIGLICDFDNPGNWYEIPWRCLYKREVGNLLAAGRIISAVGYAWDVVRVIPCAALTGQAAGTAAALMLGHNCTADELPVDTLQKALTAQNVRLHRES